MKRSTSLPFLALGLALAAQLSFVVPAGAGIDVLGYSQTGLLGYANAVAAAPTGDVYVAGQSGIARVAPDGQSALPFLALENAHGVAVDSDGNVYVSPDNPSGPGGVSKYTSGGTLLWHASPNLYNGLSNGSLSVAKGIVWFTTYDMAYGLDASDGQLVHSFAVSTNSQEIVALPNGNVLVGHNRITGGLTEFTPSGSQVRLIPNFSLRFTVDTEGTIIGNEFKSDGSLQTRVIALSASGELKSAPLRNQEAQFMDYAVDSAGVVWAVMVPSSAGAPQLLRLDPTTPDVVLTGATGVVADQAASFDASSSTVPFGKVTQFEWDLDDDGVYELNSGTDGTIEHIFSVSGAHPVSVRVTAERGGTDTAQLSVQVSPSWSSPPPGAPAPPLPEQPGSGAEPAPVPAAGPVGVSVNDGARYTNDPDVEIVARWPLGYRQVVVSNDGGFVPSVQGAVQGTITWRLDSSGPERLPKTIYVRFLDGSRVSETYQDDIILDQTKPSLMQGTATPSAVSARIRTDVLGRAVLRQFTVKTKATDMTSGVRKMQITGNKGRAGKWLSYKKSRSYRTSSSKIFVRVRDGAGNVSGWKRLR